MEPYWSYEDIGAFFFVLVVVAAVVRLGIRTHLLGPSDLVAPSLTRCKSRSSFPWASLCTRSSSGAARSR
jgi:hypothetical protein